MKNAYADTSHVKRWSLKESWPAAFSSLLPRSRHSPLAGFPEITHPKEVGAPLRARASQVGKGNNFCPSWNVWVDFCTRDSKRRDRSWDFCAWGREEERGGSLWFFPPSRSPDLQQHFLLLFLEFGQKKLLPRATREHVREIQFTLCKDIWM